MKALGIMALCLSLGLSGCEAPSTRSSGPTLDQIRAALRMSDSEWNDFILLVTSVGEFTIFDARPMRTGEISVMLVDPKADGRDGHPAIMVERVNGVLTITKGLEAGLKWRGPFVIP